MKRSEGKRSTKARILETAIAMFNDGGVKKVTCRHIAAEMGISYGNLNYHYPTKEDLLLAIYKQMRVEMSQSYLLRETGPSAFEHFYRLLQHLEQFQYKFRFFNLDVLEISRSYPQLNRILQRNIKIRKAQVSNLFDNFIAEGLIRARPEREYQQLQHTIRIVITFWLSQEVILASFNTKQIGGMSDHIWGLLIPIMTDRGRAEYDRLLQAITTRQV